MTHGLVIAAPASRSGKTVITLALLRAFRKAGRRIGSLKIGPDYIDPGFHRAASGGDCRNYDPWAMRPATLDHQVSVVAANSDLVIAEGVTGLFDGAADGTGSTAEAASRLGWPVILVVDVRGQGASAAAVVEGFASHRQDTAIVGVLLNRVGSERHRDILRRAMTPSGIPVIGMIPESTALALPERHLGLVEAAILPALDGQIDAAAALLAAEIDLTRLEALAAPAKVPEDDAAPVPVPPPGGTIAIAADAAFSFAYPHMLEGWKRAGSEITYFSPLADEPPDAATDAVFLPGGYPELDAGRLAANSAFLGGLRTAADRGAVIFGECGGFMVLGERLIDRDGAAHAMAGLLPVETSFAAPRRHLGYRQIVLRQPCFLGPAGTRFRGHEFHYSTRVDSNDDDALFDITDATCTLQERAGCQRGNVMGAYIHLIDRIG